MSCEGKPFEADDATDPAAQLGMLQQLLAEHLGQPNQPSHDPLIREAEVGNQSLHLLEALRQLIALLSPPHVDTAAVVMQLLDTPRFIQLLCGRIRDASEFTNQLVAMVIFDREFRNLVHSAVSQQVNAQLPRLVTGWFAQNLTRRTLTIDHGPRWAMVGLGSLLGALVTFVLMFFINASAIGIEQSNATITVAEIVDQRPFQIGAAILGGIIGALLGALNRRKESIEVPVFFQGGQGC